jgi:hypothetical protein
MPIGRLDPPSLPRAALLDGRRLAVQRHRRTYVPRHPIQTIPHLPSICIIHLDDKMFFAVRNRAREGSVQKVNTRMRVLRRNGLVAEVQTKPSLARLADDARQHLGGVKRICPRNQIWLNGLAVRLLCFRNMT